MEDRGKWRLIVDNAAGAAQNMAKDEALLRGLQLGQGLPTLRLYEWREPALSIGRHQSVEGLRGADREEPLPMVRRITGGRAVLHHMELTYSVVCDERHELFSYGIQGAYRSISRCIVAALKDVGVKAEIATIGSERALLKKQSCFHAPARFEVIAGGRKIVGSSQRRFRGALLQHGSVLFAVDKTLTNGVFGDGAARRMSCVSEFTDSTMAELKAAMAARISEGLGVTFEQTEPFDGEEALIETLEGLRYSNNDWNIAGKDHAVEDGLRVQGRLKLGSAV
jgi:lipoate-protein ligase A